MRINERLNVELSAPKLALKIIELARYIDLHAAGVAGGVIDLGEDEHYETIGSVSNLLGSSLLNMAKSRGLREQGDNPYAVKDGRVLLRQQLSILRSKPQAERCSLDDLAEIVYEQIDERY